jgi:hypothetical protein
MPPDNDEHKGARGCLAAPALPLTSEEWERQMAINEVPSTDSAFKAAGVPATGWIGEIVDPRRRHRVRSTALVRLRARSVRPKRCQALARQLRTTAALTQPPSRLDRITVPVLLDRVARARTELLALASALEHEAHPSPDCVAIVNELMHDGSGPIYNPSVPEAELTRALTEARAGLTAI